MHQVQCSQLDSGEERGARVGRLTERVFPGFQRKSELFQLFQSVMKWRFPLFFHGKLQAPCAIGRDGVPSFFAPGYMCLSLSDVSADFSLEMEWHKISVHLRVGSAAGRYGSVVQTSNWAKHSGKNKGKNIPFSFIVAWRTYVRQVTFFQ